MRILIADDNPAIRSGIVELLTRHSWEVCGEASDGLETIEKARRLRPDLVLLDVSMPGTNGFETASALKRESPTLKVLIVSQHDLARMLPESDKKLVDGFVDKAGIGTTLVRAIRELLPTDPR